MIVKQSYKFKLDQSQASNLDPKSFTGDSVAGGMIMHDVIAGKHG